jgi:hypothetical protein
VHDALNRKWGCCIEEAQHRTHILVLHPRAVHCHLRGGHSLLDLQLRTKDGMLGGIVAALPR